MDIGQLDLMKNLKKGHLEFSGFFFLAEIFTRLSARKSEQMKNF